MKKQKFLIVDSNNLFYRARHVVRGDSIETKIGLLYHIFFNSLLKANQIFQPEYTIFSFDSSSWRKEEYPEYKENRKVKDSLKDEITKQEDREFYSAFDNLFLFLKEKTNSMVVKCHSLESDDLISEFIFLNKRKNPEGLYIILSSDKDFQQLLDDRIIIYDGFNEKIFYTGEKVIQNFEILSEQIKGIKFERVDDPEWELFKKIVRGDPSDNIFPSYPGVREKRIKNAFVDRERKGFDWTNFMLQEVINRHGKKVKVIENFEKNLKIISLFDKPEKIRILAEKTIFNSLNEKKRNGVGINFLKFCNKYGLENLKNRADKIGEILNKKPSKL